MWKKKSKSFLLGEQDHLTWVLCVIRVFLRMWFFVMTTNPSYTVFFSCLTLSVSVNKENHLSYCRIIIWHIYKLCALLCSTVEENTTYFESELFEDKCSANAVCPPPQGPQSCKNPSPSPPAGPCCRASLVLKDFQGLGKLITPSWQLNYFCSEVRRVSSLCCRAGENYRRTCGSDLRVPPGRVHTVQAAGFGLLCLLECWPDMSGPVRLYCGHDRVRFGTMDSPRHTVCGANNLVSKFSARFGSICLFYVAGNIKLKVKNDNLP